MVAYAIARIDVSNLEDYKVYASQTVAMAEKFGGNFLVKAGEFDQIEGAGPERHVVIEFPTRAMLHEWYNSPEYQAILPIALANSTRDLVFVDGAE